MYYLEEVDKLDFSIKKLFKKIIIKENKLILPIKKEIMNEKLSDKMAKKTNKILLQTKSNKIVLSKFLQKNEMYCNKLNSYGYKIVDGKWLFEGVSLKVLDYILEKKQLNKEECSISILVNDLSDYTLQNMKKIASEYKMVNVVTNYIDKFKKIEEKILEENGLLITVTNNKKKSLKGSQIILNIDFPKELLNKYNVYEKAIIVNIQGNMKLNKKRFNGLIINNYEIKINNEIIDSLVGNSKEKYYLSQLYESNFYYNMTYQDFIKKINHDKLDIDFLETLNGTL